MVSSSSLYLQSFFFCFFWSLGCLVSNVPTDCAQFSSNITTKMALLFFSSLCNLYVIPLSKLIGMHNTFFHKYLINLAQSVEVWNEHVLFIICWSLKLVNIELVNIERDFFFHILPDLGEKAETNTSRERWRHSGWEKGGHRGRETETPGERCTHQERGGCFGCSHGHILACSKLNIS